MNKIIHLLKTSKSQTQIYQIQAQLITNNHLQNTTISHHLITACRALNLLPTLYTLYTHHLPFEPHVFTCNTLLKILNPKPAISYYKHMHANSITPNNYTFPLVLKAISDVKDIAWAKMVHTHVVKMGYDNDVYVKNALMGAYVSVGDMVVCGQVFDEMSDKDVVSWTVMIMGFRQCGMFKDGLVVFEEMMYAGVVPNRVTMVNVLATCGRCGDVGMGVWVHEVIKRNEWEVDVVLGTSLVDMYGKCGRVREALDVFVSMEDKNAFTWNSLIKGLANVKFVEGALWWFSKMEQEEGIKPDEVTLVVILSACAHSGLVDIGREIFSSLVNGKYGFLPNTKHYACLVDLLARSGSLQEAMEVIKEMPFEPSKSVWGALLAGSRAHGDLELTEFAAWNLIKLAPNNRTCYVVLCSLYTELGKWNELERVRMLMKVRGIKNDLGVAPLEAKYMTSY